MSHALYRWGRWAARRPWTVLGVWLVVAVVVVASSAAFGGTLEDEFSAPGLDSTTATELLTRAASDNAGPTAQVVVTPSDGGTFADSPQALTELTQLRAAIVALPNVLGASDPVTEPAGSLSADGRIALIRVQYAAVGELSVVDLDRLKAVDDQLLSNEPAITVEMNGDLFFTFEQPEANIGEALGLLAAIIILLLAFGSLIAMGLPIGLALFGLALGISSFALIDHLIDIPSWASGIATMVGLGVGIDYALFLVTRHREFLARGMTVEEAAGRANATAGQAVIFAGGTVVIAILGLAVAGVPFMTAAGVAISVTVLVMVVASVTLLPAFLGLAGHHINRWGIHRRHRARSVTATSERWERWGRHVARHAGAYAIGVTVGLLAVAAPTFSMRLGFPDDGSQPETRTQRRAYDLVAEGFGPGTNGPLVIAVDLRGDTAVVDALSTAIAADPGIASVAPAQVNEAEGVAVIVAIPTSAPQDNATYTTIDRLRADVLPTALGDSEASAHVGGQTATFGDLGRRVSDRLPWFIGAVLLLSILLLMLVFRSIVVAVKAAVMNILSIGAAFGVMVMVFQWGWGKDLIGLESTVPVIAFIPMFMFAILFGLSMDYEVFLLSRVREEYLRTGDNDASVLHGIAITARVITSAALIMICVFLGFVLGEDPLTKMMGLGLATAIFIDATVVRMVLVPAAMKLMGDANWWLPKWLDRRMPTIDIDGETGLPEPEMESAATAATATVERELVRS
ncbi:MAG: MMPL family transporter [Ilumatobacteraceae bacterium]